jgi:hypothetical protein
MKQYKLQAVSNLLGIAPHRIAYTFKNGVLSARKRRYLHHWYTPGEIVLLAGYFDVPVPDEFANLELKHKE